MPGSSKDHLINSFSQGGAARGRGGWAESRPRVPACMSLCRLKPQNLLEVGEGDSWAPGPREPTPGPPSTAAVPRAGSRGQHTPLFQPLQWALSGGPQVGSGGGGLGGSALRGDQQSPLPGTSSVSIQHSHPRPFHHLQQPLPTSQWGSWGLGLRQPPAHLGAGFSKPLQPLLCPC